MPGFADRVILGRSGLSVCPLAVSGGYGVSARAIHKAVDRGVNYLYHGSRRVSGMTQAIRELVRDGKRDNIVVVLQSYTRWPFFVERSLAKGLRDLGLEYADVLLLGWYNRFPRRVLERSQRLVDKGMCRHIAISGHKRPAFVDYAPDPRLEIFHIRYNAAHTGAEHDIFPQLPKENRPGIVAYTATKWGQLLKARRMPPGEAPLQGRDAYRFVLSNTDFNVCMTGPKNDAEMDEALAALDEGPLSPEETARIRKIGHWIRSHGKTS